MCVLVASFLLLEVCGKLITIYLFKWYLLGRFWYVFFSLDGSGLLSCIFVE